MSEPRFDGKVVVVVGVGVVGEAIAARFATEGAAVALVDRDRARVEAVAERIGAAGGNAAPLVADVTDEAQVAAAMATVEDRLGRLDVLYNNTGVGGPGDRDIVDLEWDVFVRAMLTNAGGVMLA